MAATENQLKLHRLMYTLFYPAVLGSMILGLLLGLAEGHVSFNEPFFWGLFLVFYFSSQHVENILYDEGYTFVIFLLDLVEVGLILGLFLLLGLYSPEHAPVSPSPGVWRWFYGLLALAFVIPLLCRVLGEGALGGAGLAKSVHAGLAAGLSALAIGIGGDASLLFLLGLIFLSYLLFLVFNLDPKQMTLGAQARFRRFIPSGKDAANHPD